MPNATGVLLDVLRELRGPVIPKTYYAKRLLEHGPLANREFSEITGWPRKEARKTLESLSRSGETVCEGGVWRLT